MCWKKNLSRFFRTVKFRTALWYALLFSVSGLLLFFSVYFILESGMIKAVDKQLFALSRELEDGYFKAAPADKIKALENGYRREAHYQGTNRIFYRLRDNDGKVLSESGGKSWERLAKNTSYRNAVVLGKAVTAPVYSRSSVRLLERPLTEGRILETGIDLSTEEDLLKIYSSVFFIVFAVLLAVSAAIGWLLAGRAMKGVDTVSEAVSAISHGDFSRQVAVTNVGTEIENLAAAFNEMRGRIESLIFELREVSDNIAHDLRTPLTRIRGMVETTVRGNPEVADYDVMAGGIVEECDRLIGMINTMLEITRTGSGAVELNFAAVDMKQLVSQAHELFQPLAEMKEIAFSVSLPETPVMVSGDRARLQRVIANLVDNAIKYTPDKGRVDLTLAICNGRVVMTVTDSGIGIQEKDLSHIFERFYRCDASRTQAGNGLGLSLVDALVKAHKGVIAVSSRIGEGTTFTVTFPPLV